MSGYKDELVNGLPLKGIVRQKLRWVKSGINHSLFLHYLVADTFCFYLKGHYSLKSIKPVLALYSVTSSLCQVEFMSGRRG
jgi:hypothetical protein